MSMLLSSSLSIVNEKRQKKRVWMDGPSILLDFQTTTPTTPTKLQTEPFIIPYGYNYSSFRIKDITQAIIIQASCTIYILYDANINITSSSFNQIGNLSLVADNNNDENENDNDSSNTSSRHVESNSWSDVPATNAINVGTIDEKAGSIIVTYNNDQQIRNIISSYCFQHHTVLIVEGLSKDNSSTTSQIQLQLEIELEKIDDDEEQQQHHAHSTTTTTTTTVQPIHSLNVSSNREMLLNSQDTTTTTRTVERDTTTIPIPITSSASESSSTLPAQWKHHATYWSIIFSKSCIRKVLFLCLLFILLCLSVLIKNWIVAVIGFALMAFCCLFTTDVLSDDEM